MQRRVQEPDTDHKVHRQTWLFLQKPQRAPRSANNYASRTAKNARPICGHRQQRQRQQERAGRASFVRRAAQKWFQSELALFASQLAHASMSRSQTPFFSGNVETSLQEPSFAQFPAAQFRQLPVVRTAVSCDPGSLLGVAAACKRLADPGTPSSVSLPASAGRQRADRLELSVSVLCSLALVPGSGTHRRRSVSQLLTPAVGCCSRSPTEQIWPASPRQQKGTLEVSATVRDCACVLFRSEHAGIDCLGLQMAD